MFEYHSISRYIGAVLIGVAMINAMIEFVQEMKSESIMQGFLNLVPRNCTVIREKSLTNRPAADLVRGDLVNIRMGDKIPADIRIIWASDFKVYIILIF